MKRIDTKDGLFDDGNHVFGIHGTRVSAEFLNDIQEEIVNVIGARNLDGSKRDQLITAIRNIVKSGGGSSSGSAITQADQDKIDSSYHKLKHFVEDELGLALDAKNDAQLKTAIDSAIAKLQAQLDDIRKKMTNGSTETTAGVAEIATQNEANDGNDDSKIVTPKKLKTITRDLDSRATRIRNDVDKNTADLVTHRTDIQQNTTDIVSNTASIATIITTIKKGITTGKLAKSFTVPSVLHDKIQLDGEDTAGHYGYAVAMHNDYLAVSDPVLQEVVIYRRDKNNKKIFNLEDIHKGKKHGDIFVEDGQVYVKRKNGKFLDIFEYDENQTNLTFRKVNTINLSLSYGNSLAINDDYLIVGNPHSKTALIYKHSGIKWQLVKQLMGGDSFGSSVAVNYKYILVSEVANKKAEVYKISRGFDFSAERVTGRFKVKSDVYLNAPTASTAGFLGYTVADDDGVNYSQIAQNLDDNAVYVRHFSAGNNGAWSSSDIAAFKQKTNLNKRTNQNDYVQRYYSTNQVNKKLMIGFCFQQHSANLTDYIFTGHLFIEVETNKIYYHCYDNGGGSWVTEISDKLKIDEFKKMMSFTNRVLPYVLSTTVEAVNGFKATVNTQGKAGSGDSDVNTFITFEENNVKKSFQFTVDDEAIVYLNTKTGGAWGGWSNIAGTRPADPLQLEVVPPPAIKHFKTLTGGASYSKLIDLNGELSAFAEPDNNILKIYENLAEIASKTVKADCINVGKGIVLATSKTDKKAYIYDFYGKTGWFTTTKTKWAGLPDNAKGYTGYNIKGGQYQLVRPVGTTDTYTKFGKDGAWIKNGIWGGVLWYDGSKIGFKKGDNQWYQIGNKISFSGGVYECSIALTTEGNTLALGADFDSYVEVYDYINEQWVLRGGRILPKTTSKEFGSGVDISENGKILCIGANDDNYVEVYEYKNGSWQQKGSRINGAGGLGRSVSITKDGSVIACGGDYTLVEVYEYVNNMWQQKGQQITGTGKFGRGVSITDDGNTVLCNSDENYVEVYTYKTNKWVLKGQRITIVSSLEPDLTADGNTFIVCVRNAYVEVYEYKNNKWQLKGNRINGSYFSCSIADDGVTIVLSDEQNHFIRVFKYIGNAWVVKSLDLIDVGNTAAVTISGDGSTVASGRWRTSRVSVYRINKEDKLYLETTDGKHYHDNKELKDATEFDTLMETVAPLSPLQGTIVQANRNLRLTKTDIQEQPNKTGAYVSLLGAGTATTAKSIDDTNFTIDSNYGDACAITADKVLITNKTDSKLAIYDHLGTKQKEIQLETGVGSVIDATDTEAIVGSETANTVDVISLKI